MMPKGLRITGICCLILLLAACGDEAAPPAQSANATSAASESAEPAKVAAPANATAAAQSAPAAAPANATAAEAAPVETLPFATSTNATAEAAADDVQEAAAEAADQEARKWNSYVILANEVDARVLALLEDYVANFPEREYSAPGADFVFQRQGGDHRPRGVAGAVNEAMANALLEPQSELDPLALAYARSLNDLWQALNAAIDYYSDGAYKDDALARGPALHEAVVAASQAYWPVSDAFGLALLRRDEEMMSASVADLRKKGMPLHAAVLDLVLRARELERELYKLFQEEDKAPDFADPAFAGAAEKFSRACRTLEKKLADAGQRQKEDIGDEAAAALGDSARSMCERAPGAAAEAGRDGAASHGEQDDAARGALLDGLAALDEFPELMNVFIGNVNIHLQ